MRNCLTCKKCYNCPRSPLCVELVQQLYLPTIKYISEHQNQFKSLMLLEFLTELLKLFIIGIYVSRGAVYSVEMLIHILLVYMKIKHLGLGPTLKM